MVKSMQGGRQPYFELEERKMKKWIAMLLAAILCLSLCACGSSKYEKYDTIIDALEQKDYEGAIEEIYKLYLAENGGEAGGDDQDPTDESEADPDMLKWQELAPSEYIAKSYNEDKPVDNFTLNADGTCLVEGKSLNWLLDSADENYAAINVMDGMVKAYRINLNLYEEGYVTASLGFFQDEYSTSGVDANFFRSANLTAIELTVDNWQDYFEPYEHISITKNSFGEITGIDVSRYMVVKEAYGFVVADLSKVAVEYTYSDVRQKVTADPNAGTYTLGEIVDTYGPYGPTTSSMYGRHSDDGVHRYGMSCGSFYIGKFPEDEVSVRTDLTMTRLMGTIYVVEP